MKTLTKYDILVVVSNRLYLVLVIGLHTRYGYRYLSTSRGAGNLLVIIFILLYLYVQLPIYLARGRKRINVTPVIKEDFRIDPYLPREGPETMFRSTKFQIKSRIATYLPREGPETLPKSPLGLQKHSYSYLSTSRGAGNMTSWGIQVPLSLSVQLPIYLARGRKRIYCVLSQNFYDRSGTYLPRKGLEKLFACARISE